MYAKKSLKDIQRKKCISISSNKKGIKRTKMVNYDGRVNKNLRLRLKFKKGKKSK